MDKTIERLQACMKDEAFVKELLGKDNAQEAQSFLEENGINLSIAEVEEIGANLAKVANGEISKETVENFSAEELTEDELENAAGGICFLAAMLITGAVIGTTGGVAYGSYKFDIRW